MTEKTRHEIEVLEHVIHLANLPGMTLEKLKKVLEAFISTSKRVEKILSEIGEEV